MKPDEPIVIREFQYLTPDVKGENCVPLSTEQFALLRKFILTNREGDSPVELMKLCSPKRIGEAMITN